ncbi:MAG: HD-GYP domain-containing protein [Sphingomonas sp.]
MAPSAFEDSDWRGRTNGGATPRDQRNRTGQRDPFHRKARKGSVQDEIARARELVAAAKSAVMDAFDAIGEGRPVDAPSLEPVVSGIAAAMARNATALPGVLRLKERHEYTYLHSLSVCGLMIGLARDLGLAEALMPDIGLAGLLHDIGKVRVPTLLLDKAGPLNDDEFGVVRQHVERGRDILIEAGSIPPIVHDVCLHHHERMDGRGYPAGVTGDQLSIYARMGTICDVYDAVTSARAYKRSWSPGEALEWMTSTTGHFDPRLLSAFTAMIGVFPIGSLVRLRSERLAVVLEGSTDGAPELGIFFCATTNMPLPWKLGNAGLDPVIGLERADRWAIGDWVDTREAIFAHFGAEKDAA